MEHLYKQLSLDSEDTVEVSIDHQANVMLMDWSNYSSYQAGRDFRYFGGNFTRSPCRITPPHSGTWYLVIDLGGAAGHIRHSFRVIRPPLAG